MLPDHATNYSKRLLPTAQALVDQCPAAMYDVVLLTGSVSRGDADILSDVEVFFVVDELQERRVYEQWMESLDGYDATIPTRARENTDYTLECFFNGIEIGMVWIAWETLEREIDAVFETPNQADLAMPWIVNHSVPFNASDRMDRLKARCAVYPDSVRRKIIDANLAGWRKLLAVPHIANAVNSLYRGEIFDVRRRQFYGIYGMLDVIFAHNRHWLVDYKWLTKAFEKMPDTPPNFLDRLNALLCTADADTTIKMSASLIYDTLDLLSPEFDVADLKQAYAYYRDQGLSCFLPSGKA